MEKPTAEMYPVKIGPYFQGHLIGAGGFGVVFQGIHEITGEEKAIKLVWMKEGQLDILHKELAILEIISNNPHPNLLGVDSIIKSPFSAYVIMEKLNDGNLEKYLINQPEGRMKEEEARIIFSQFLKGLKNLHKNKIMHRDIKPGNILLDFSNSENFLPKIKIIDFGLAEIFEDENKKLNLMAGTQGFMAPEVQVASRKKGEERGYLPIPADIYSSGVLLFFMVTSLLPPPQHSSPPPLQIQVEEREEGFSNPILSAELSDLIFKMLQKNPENRISIEEIENHPWMDENLTASDLLESAEKVRLALIEKNKKNKNKFSNYPTYDFESDYFDYYSDYFENSKNKKIENFNSLLFEDDLPPFDPKNYENLKNFGSFENNFDENDLFPLRYKDDF